MPLETEKIEYKENPETPRLRDSDHSNTAEGMQQLQGDIDETVKNLEESGQLKEVVGSQSVLTQEWNAENDVQSGVGTQTPPNDPVAIPSCNDIAESQEESQVVLESQDSVKLPASYFESQNYEIADGDKPAIDNMQDEDEAVRGLEETGAIQQVVGSQSLLSQELPADIDEEHLLDATTAAKTYAHFSTENSKSLLQRHDVRMSQESLQHSSVTSFETLLDAVELVKERETNNPMVKKRKASDSDLSAPKGKQRKSFPAPDHVVISLKRKPKLTKTRDKSTPDPEVAQKAAELAARTIHDADLAKKLLLSMALSRTNPRIPPEVLPDSGHVLQHRFFWAHYPPLEAVLKEAMPKYYSLSIEKCQSVEQQNFNNDLVTRVLEVANRRGWVFDPRAFVSNKVLRDRIRCYYKTHIQNAKKRLNTMLRNPTKRANAVHLMEHYEMIQSALKDHDSSSS